jgi:hypothetical protein
VYEVLQLADSLSDPEDAASQLEHPCSYTPQKHIPMQRLLP